MPTIDKQFEKNIIKVLNVRFSLALRKAGEIYHNNNRYKIDLYDPEKSFYVDIYESFNTEDRSEFVNKGKSLHNLFNNQNKSGYYCIVFNDNLTQSDADFLLDNALPKSLKVKTIIFSQHEILNLVQELEAKTTSSTDSKTYRLGRVAGELDVGISTMIDFLKNEGIQIDTNPNSKLDPDIYQLLKTRFNKSDATLDRIQRSRYLWVNFEDTLQDQDNLSVGLKGSINLGYATIDNDIKGQKFQGQAIIYPIEFERTLFLYVSYDASNRNGQLLLNYEIKEVIQSKLQISNVLEYVGSSNPNLRFDILSRVVTIFTASEFDFIIPLIRELQIGDKPFDNVESDDFIQSEGQNIQNGFQKTTLTNDSVQSKRDLLGFENDIRAFASLIALKEMKPPLAIGLFGKWGSGKSFFMYNLQDRINHLSIHQGFENLNDVNNEDDIEKPFCEGVVHVTFNAWSYMDANLWASLVATIFEELDAYISGQKLSDREKGKVRQILNERLSFVNEEKEKIVQDRKELFVNEKELINKSLELQKKKYDLEIQKNPNNYLKLIRKVIKELGFEKEINELVPNVSDEKLIQLSENELRHEVAGWKSFWRTIEEAPRWTIFACLIGIAILAVSWIYPFSMKTLIRYVGTSVMMIPGISYLLVTKIKFLKAYGKVKKYRDQIKKLLKEEQSKLLANISQVNKDIEQTNNELVLKQAKLDILESEIQNLNFDLENSVTKQAFFDFISTKSKDERYQQNLSIISIIRKDFQILSELFNDYNTGGDEINEDRKSINQLLNKPLDRIVLYVDDLDRCQEDRVVEVLEAVNLLMAYPLFVVVVGVDPRWVKNALIKRYSMQFTGQLGNTGHALEQIHVADYLEKIFQIPFHLYEANEDGNKRILEDILGNQIKLEEDSQSERAVHLMSQNNDIPEDVIEEIVNQEERLDVELKRSTPIRVLPKDLKISRQELDDLQSLSWLAGNNPRTLKRYANIYRIVRVHEDLNYDKDTERDNFLVIMFLIGMSVGPYRHLAHDFYIKCEQEPILTFSAIIDLVLRDNKVDVSSRNPFLGVSKNLDNAFGDDFCRYIDFVKRFSF